jgi:putative DNA primase/helicase
MATAEIIARALGGRKMGTAWMARCPAHDDREPSLAITDTRDGRVLVHCHAGCDQRDVITALRARNAWERQRSPDRCFCKADHESPAQPDRDAARRTKAALAIWCASRPAEGTPGETYLRSRGFAIPVPLAIRFHAGSKHPSGGVWPAMVAG